MAIPTLQYLPPWSASYSYDVEPGIIRSPVTRGATRQRNIRSRRMRIANVTRTLRRSELPYFEAFIRAHCKDGSSKFIDTYADQNGLQTGTVRIVEGSYSVQTDLLNHVITCQLEVFG